MQSELVTYSAEGEIALLGPNRPEKRNAVSDRVVEAIGAAVARAESESKPGVFYGHGDHFCAGLDLAEHSQKTPIEGVWGSRRWHAVFDHPARLHSLGFGAARGRCGRGT